MHQQRKAAYVQRPYNPGNAKSYSQHYGSYAQPIQGENSFPQPNGNNTNQRAHPVPLAGFGSQPSQQIRTQPGHQVHPAGQHQLVTVSTSNQNMALTNQAQVSVPNSVGSGPHHDIGIPAGATGMPITSTVPGLQTAVMYPTGGQGPTQFFATQQLPQRLVTNPVYYHQYPQQNIIGVPNQFPQQFGGNTRPQYSGHVPLPPTQGYAYSIPTAYNQGGQGPQQPHQQPPTTQPPPPTKAPPRVKNPLKIIDPDTGEEVNLKEPSKEGQAAAQTASQPLQQTPPESSNAGSTSDAAQEFATMVAASMNKESPVPEKPTPEEVPAVPVSVEPVPVAEPEPEPSPVPADTVDCKAPLVRAQFDEIPRLAAQPPKEQRTQKRRKTPSPDLTKEPPKEVQKPQVPVEEIQETRAPTPPAPVKPKEDAPKPKSKAKAKNSVVDKEPAVVIPASEAESSAEVQFGDVSVEALVAEKPDKNKQPQSSKPAPPAPQEHVEPPKPVEAPKKVAPKPREPSPPKVPTPVEPEEGPVEVPQEAASAAAEAPAEAAPEDATPAPINVEGFRKNGVLMYSKEHIMSLQRGNLSLQKPGDLPPLEIIKNEPHSKAYDSKQPPKDFFPFPHGRNSQHGNYNNRSRKGESQRRDGYGVAAGQGGQNPRVINFAKNQDLKNKAANPWKPELNAEPATASLADVPVEKKMKKIRAILNKLTPDNFGKSLSVLGTMKLGGQEEVKALSDMIFEKAANESHFAELYARLVKSLDENINSRLLPNMPKGQLRKDIVARCQYEFEGTYKKDESKKDNFQLDIEQCEKNRDEAKLALSKDLTNKSLLARYKYCEALHSEAIFARESARNKYSAGTVVFIGHMFLSNQLTGPNILQVIAGLVAQKSELSMHSLLRLLETIGPVISEKIKTASAAIEKFDAVFKNIVNISSDKNVSFRTRCFAMDCVELRQNNWKPRTEKIKPVTTKEIQAKARQEQNEREMQKQQERYEPQNNYPSVKRNPTDWNTAGSQKARERFDLQKISNNLFQDPTELNLRPNLGNWGVGSSGGLNTATSVASSGGAAGGNRYAVLETHGMGGNRGRLSNTRVAGSTKSTPGPGERKGSGSRSGSADPRGKSTSQTREMTPARQAAEEDEFGFVPALEPSHGYTLEKIECIAESSVKEYLTDYGNIDDLIHDVKKLQSEVNMAIYAEYFFQHSCMTLKNNRRLGSAFKDLSKTHKLFSQARLVRAVKCFAAMIADIKCDIPFVYKYTAEMLGGMLDGDFFTEETMKSCFAKVPGEQELIRDAIEASKVSVPVNKADVRYIEEKILNVLRTESNEAVSAYIDNEIKADKDSEVFIRAVTRAVVKSCLDLTKRNNEEVFFDSNRFKERVVILQMCLDNKQKREVTAIFAIQTLSHELQHPLKLFSSLLAILYEHDVVTDESVAEWRDDASFDPDRQEGKGVCVTSATAFIRYVFQVAPDS